MRTVVIGHRSTSVPRPHRDRSPGARSSPRATPQGPRRIPDMRSSARSRSAPESFGRMRGIFLARVAPIFRIEKNSGVSQSLLQRKRWNLRRRNCYSENRASWPLRAPVRLAQNACRQPDSQPPLRVGWPAFSRASARSSRSPGFCSVMRVRIERRHGFGGLVQRNAAARRATGALLRDHRIGIVLRESA